MIVSFKCKETAKIFFGLSSRKFPPSIHRRASAKLSILHGARSLDALLVPPGNQLKMLKGEMGGKWSIRINRQWRICFIWENGEAKEVEITDYH